jgi:20S proteasome subunit alpha 7
MFNLLFLDNFRIYLVHDELKDKHFELELSWVGKHTNGLHVKVPDNVQQEAEKTAKAALEEESDSEEDI